YIVITAHLHAHHHIRRVIPGRQKDYGQTGNVPDPSAPVKAIIFREGNIYDYKIRLPFDEIIHHIREISDTEYAVIPLCEPFFQFPEQAFIIFYYENLRHISLPLRISSIKISSSIIYETGYFVSCSNI